MNPEDIQQKEQKHDVSIALIQKDIEYIKKSTDSLNTQMLLMDKNFVKHEQVVGLAESIKDILKKLENKADHADIKSMVDILAKKVDYKDFEPIRGALTRINWMVISAVVIGLLALIIKSG